MSTVSKNEIARVVAKNTGKTIKEVTEIVDAAFDEIFDSLARGDSFQILGQLKLAPITTTEHFAKNPGTGETILVKGYRRVKFSMGSKLKEKLN